MAVVAIVFVVAVAFTLKKRVTPQTHAPLARTDEAVLKAAGEPGIPHATVWLDLDNDGRLDGNEPSMATTSSGRYSFSDLLIQLVKEGKVRDAEGTVEVHGNVHVKVSDGLEVTSEDATFTKSDGIARAPSVLLLVGEHQLAPRLAHVPLDA